jgi:hypothetical protein
MSFLRSYPLGFDTTARYMRCEKGYKDSNGKRTPEFHGLATTWRRQVSVS